MELIKETITKEGVVITMLKQWSLNKDDFMIFMDGVLCYSNSDISFATNEFNRRVKSFGG